MSIPKDRVHFTLKECHARDVAFRRAFEEAFGRAFPPNVYADTPHTVVCRPSQFRELIALLTKLGGSKESRDLEPRPGGEVISRVVDVSRNLHQEC